MSSSDYSDKSTVFYDNKEHNALFMLSGAYYALGLPYVNSKVSQWTITPGVNHFVKDWIENCGGYSEKHESISNVIQTITTRCGNLDTPFYQSDEGKVAYRQMFDGINLLKNEVAKLTQPYEFLISYGDEDIQVVVMEK